MAAEEEDPNDLTEYLKPENLLKVDDPGIPPYRHLNFQHPTVISREQWGAVPPKESVPLAHPTPHILYTFTGTEECDTREDCIKAVQALQNRDMNERGMPDIQYNFLVGGDAVVYEGRGWHAQATKDPKHAYLDGSSLDIAYIGNFRDKNPFMEVLIAGGGILSHGLTNKFVRDDFDITSLWESQSLDVDELIEKGELHKIKLHYKYPPPKSDTYF